MNFQLEIQTGAQAGFNFRVLFVDFPSRKPGRNWKVKCTACKKKKRKKNGDLYLFVLCLIDYKVVQMLLKILEARRDRIMDDFFFFSFDSFFSRDFSLYFKLFLSIFRIYISIHHIKIDFVKMI